ncbi:amidohydrolase family protein [Rhodococcus sp. WAY2]|uniref:amidohydrolase family protein n=1 Tax=Rhodococcus sp. WAY2 TaxID=2663121 RepID=UPI00131FF5CF|nr:amidohydrolase family protein [Rhodococcus sp. WAY2]QHE73278.1 BarH [Rhodococcus sp. WAY2]
MLTDDVKLISVDDHVIEPRHVWEKYLPAKYREAGPRVVRPDNGPDEFWEWEGRRYPVQLQGSPTTRIFRDEGGSDRDFRSNSYDDMIPACYDVDERVKAMDVDGVQASLCFPQWPRFAGTRFLEATDWDLAAACVSAWNDWMLDEWCASYPDRFIPMSIIPLWDPVAAAAEMRRCAAKGSRTITMIENPTTLGLPSWWTDHWDPVFAAAEETGLVLSTHIGTGGKLFSPSTESTEAVQISLCGVNSMGAMVDLMYSGLLNRHPGVKVALSEGGAGWIPYMVERTQFTWERTRVGDVDKSISPVELYERHFWACFISDDIALELRDKIGMDKLMWEADFPHNDCNYPHTREMLAKQMADIPDADCKKIAETNARNLYNFHA